ncbi:MAG: molybdopterin-guanine dinucleotide biosynthesis protein B [Pseudomonadota bacterium]
MKTACYRGVPMLGFAAYSGVGKTTTLKNLLPVLLKRNIRVAVVKHTHHRFEIDLPGKDSYQLRAAGAKQIVVGNAKLRASIFETRNDREPDLVSFLSEVDTTAVEAILIEGFRHGLFPKIEVNRDVDDVLLAETDENVVAIFSDDPSHSALIAKHLPLDDVGAHADFVEEYLQLARSNLNPK